MSLKFDSAVYLMSSPELLLDHSRRYVFDLFSSRVVSEVVDKFILIIYGINGIGKTTLLQVFISFCKQKGSPFVLIHGYETRSPVEILSKIERVLSGDYGLEFSEFRSILNRYDEVKNKVNEEFHKAEKDKNLAIEFRNVITSALSLSIPASIVPLGALFGVSVGLLSNWLHRFALDRDVSLFLQPVERLTDALITDIDRIAKKQRLIMLFDDYETIESTDRWFHDLVLHLNPNVIVVIAGRKVPEWHEVSPHLNTFELNVFELQPMEENDIISLIKQSSTEKLDDLQIDAISHFSRGLPLAAKMGIMLALQGNDLEKIGDTSSVQLSSILLDKIFLREMPPTTRQLVEAASTVRWFNQNILQALTGVDSDLAWRDLERYSFIKMLPEGLVLHSVVRDVIQNHLRTNDPARYYGLHKKAADYFDVLSQSLSDEQKEIVLREVLDHLLILGDSYLQKALTLARRLKDSALTANLALRYGIELSKLGHWYDCLNLLEESLSLYRKTNDLFGRADTIYQIARTHHLMGNTDKALIYYRDAARLYERLKNREGFALCKVGLGRLAIHMGFLSDAVQELEEAHVIYADLQDAQRLKEVDEVLQLANRVKEKQPA